MRVQKDSITNVTEIDLITIREAYKLQRAAYVKSVLEHNRRCSYDQCNLYERPQKGRTCDEDLVFLNTEIDRVTDTIDQIDQILP